MAKRSGIFFFITVTALMAASAYWLLFSTFMAYDDEGYVLISLKNYSEHGGLYSQVFSQYGPFLYLLHDAGHRLLGYQFTNTNGRFITLICWVLVSILSGHVVWRHTRAVTLTGFTCGLTFFYLIHMMSEPIHPGGLIALFVAMGAWLGDAQIKRHAMRSLAVTSGLLGAALFLTKINVGVFFFAAAGTWFLVQIREIRLARWATLIAAVALSALPFALMHSELGEGWSQLFASLSAVSSLTMLVVAWRDRQPLTNWSHAGWGAAAALSLGVIVVITVCLRNTSINELVQGVLLNPLQHPGIYHYAPNWRPAAGLLSGVSLLMALCVGRGCTERIKWILIGLRLILALVFSVSALECLPFTSHSFIMSYGIPFAWIFALRLSPIDASDQRGTTSWLGLLLVLQYLHAYPVAGSQVAWGTFLIIPLMAVGLHDTQRCIAVQKKRFSGAMVGFASLVLGTTAFCRITLQGWRHYSESRPLLLSGAESLRPPENFASAARVMTLNAAIQGDMLFTLPGMYSFNNWTGLPTPTLANTTHWFSLLNKQQQEEIAIKLARSKRPVLIFHRGLIDYLTDSKFIVSSPLYDYLRSNFEHVFTVEQYEFWVRRGRTVVPINVAELLRLKTPQPGLPPFQLDLVTAIPTGRMVATIEVAMLDDETPRVLAHWDKTSGPLFSRPVNLANDEQTSESTFAWNRPLPPLSRLTLLLEKQPPAFRQSKAVVYLRASNGELLAEARFTD